MDITVKKMETDEELQGKAYVHWRSWHDAYPGLVREDYLRKLTLEKCGEIARRWPDNLLVAKEGSRIIGFLGYGRHGEDSPETGEIWSLYILPEYYGKGVGLRLMQAGLEQLRQYREVSLWVLRENARAVRFYQKCGFRPTGEEKYNANIDATEIRMLLS